jgi:hypothetical protein
MLQDGSGSLIHHHSDRFTFVLVCPEEGDWYASIRSNPEVFHIMRLLYGGCPILVHSASSCPYPVYVLAALHVISIWV